MAKRFIDSGLFDDPWFMDLSKEGKILWIYLITKCDHAGIIEVNSKMCSLQTGIKDFETVIKELGNRCVRVKQQLIFIPKYIVFQYPGFPNSKVRQQASALAILEKYNLFKDGKLTLSKDLTKSYVYDNGIVNDKELPTIKVNRDVLFSESEFSDFEKFKDQFNDTEFSDADFKYYFDSFMDWSLSGGNKKKDWIATVRNGMRKDKTLNKYRRSTTVETKPTTTYDPTKGRLLPNGFVERLDWEVR